MGDIESFTKINRFSGINNVDPEYRLSPTIIDYKPHYPLREANNVEIDNTYGLSSRRGYTSVLSGTDIHSMWADEEGHWWVFVDGDFLYQLDSIYNPLLIRSGLQKGARMSYVPVIDRLYYTNNYQIGYIKADVDNGLPDPERAFKMPLPPGQHIEYFRGCLYVASGQELYISDPFCDYFDIRTGYRRFKSDIRMLRAVDTGLYISDDKIQFLSGYANEDFELKEAYPVPAIPFTDVVVNADFIGSEAGGKVLIFTSEDGICLGDESGKIINLTNTTYQFVKRGQGTAFIREHSGGVRHYINTLY